jgi:hypothetical protein
MKISLRRIALCVLPEVLIGMPLQTRVQAGYEDRTAFARSRDRRRNSRVFAQNELSSELPDGRSRPTRCCGRRLEPNRFSGTH